MLNKVANFYHLIIHKGLDLLFPRYCFGCKKEGTALCQHCLMTLPKSIDSGENKIFSVFNYDSPIVRQLIWSLKYKRGKDIAQLVAPALNETLFEELAEKLIITSQKTRILLLPAPLSRARSRSRGYNQAQELARAMQQLNPDSFALVVGLVEKIKDTPSQVSLKNRQQRLNNLKDAFQINQAELQKLSQTYNLAETIIVIIDDVSTTGATINEIGKVLELNKLLRIYGLVLAHG